MNEKINADLKSLKFIFDKNRPYIIPVVVILVVIVLFFQFVIPQFGALIKAQKEARESSLRLEVLKKNLDMLSNTNEETLDSQLRILNLALPLNKDFIGILNSVYSIAQKTGANLGSFSFKVGDISKSESNDNFPVVKLSVPINAGVGEINSFVEAISKALPLAEVYSVKVGIVSSMVDLSFYYKPLDSSNYAQDIRVNPISQKGIILFNQLSEFENPASSLPPSMPVATSSATQ